MKIRSLGFGLYLFCIIDKEKSYYHLLNDYNANMI